MLSAWPWNVCLLYDAVRDNNLSLASYYFVTNEEIPRRILCDAARKRQVEMVKLFVKNGAPFRICGHPLLGYPVMRKAVFDNDLDTIKFLVREGVNPHAKNHSHLQLAARLGRAAIVEYLVEIGGDVRARDNLALRWATQRGHPDFDLVKFLVENGADKNYALHMAASEGNLPLVKFLIEKGADSSCRDHYALRIARWYIHEDVAAYLQSLHPTVVVAAPEYHPDAHIYEAETPDFGRTTQHIFAFLDAAGDGCVKTMQIYLDKGVDVQVWNNQALSRAAQNGHVAAVRFLLSKGARADGNGEDALIYAAAKNHPLVVELLLDAGADAHAQGDAALRRATTNGHVDVVRLLRQRGANAHAKK